MSEKADLEKLRKLWAIRGEIEEKLNAVDKEIDALLNGEEGIGSKLKRVYKAFSAAWELRYKTPYAFNYTREAPQAKRLLTTVGLTVEDIEARVARFIRRDDEFFSRRRHDFLVFVSSINEHTDRQDLPALVDEEDVSPANNCTHRPKCRTDAEHTKKRNAEMRA